MVTISDEMIESCAGLIAEEHGSTVFAADHVPYEFTDAEREQYRAEAKAVLEAAAPLIAAQVLREAYWKLRQHASELRATEVYRKASERREGTLGESPAHRRYRWLEATARGIEDGAQDIAALLGVEENEIEEPAADPESEGCHCNGCIGMGPCDDDLGKSDDGDLIDCPACLAEHYGLPDDAIEHNH